MVVLVVDDDESGRLMLEALLRGNGHDVVTAHDGVDALERARSVRPDLVVSDILMPRMDGYQLCREWKQDPELREIPFVFYTATYTDPADASFAGELGADAFITKPLDPAKFIERINTLMASGEGACPRRPPERGEASVLREYNERLIHKLEDKLVDLEKANASLNAAVGALNDEMLAKSDLVERLNEDIIERQRVEAELRDTNDKLKTLVSASPLPTILLEGEDLIVRLWNEAARDVFGWSADEVLGRPYKLIPTEEANPFAQELDLAREGGVAGLEAQRQRKDGSLVSVTISIAPLPQIPGQPIRLVTILTDISERKQLETLKQDFVSMISHELRTPLTTIIGYGDIITSSDVLEDPEKARELVRRIKGQGENLRQLVEDLLSVLQIQSDSLGLRVHPVNVSEFVEQRVQSLSHASAHVLKTDVPEGLLATFDPDMIGLVLRNLLSNAIKYSPDGGEICVRVSKDAGRIAFSVSDQGIGISDEVLPTIFDLFSQGDMSTTRRFGGTGMGLFLVKRIVEAHRGTVQVETKPGGGTTFTVELPYNGS